jgi:hypothetical protein
MYRSSSLTEAYGSPGKYSNGWCVLGCWLPIYAMKATLFTTTASRWWRNERQVLWKYYPAGRSHSAAMDRCRVARLARCIAWTFACKTHQIEKSSGFKSGYVDQSIAVQNSSKQLLGDPDSVGQHWICRKKYFPLELVLRTQGPHAVSKALWALTHSLTESSRQQPKSARPALIPLASLLSVP